MNICLSRQRSTAIIENSSKRIIKTAEHASNISKFSGIRNPRLDLEKNVSYCKYTLFNFVYLNIAQHFKCTGINYLKQVTSQATIIRRMVQYKLNQM